MKETRKDVVHHISRLEGQLASIKSELQKDDPDCLRASQTMLSASRSFAGLREEFVQMFLLEHFIDKKKVKDQKVLEQLLALIKG